MRLIILKQHRFTNFKIYLYSPPPFTVSQYLQEERSYPSVKVSEYRSVLQSLKADTISFCLVCSVSYMAFGKKIAIDEKNVLY